MTPAEGDAGAGEDPDTWLPEVGALEILNASARNCKFNPSVMRILLVPFHASFDKSRPAGWAAGGTWEMDG